MKGRIIGREGRNIRALEQATGVDLIVDDTPGAIILSGFDPWRREVARRTIERLIADGRIHPARIEEVVENGQRRRWIETARKDGEAAAFELGLHDIKPELLTLMGRLQFRTSYGQNILNHSKEVAFLAGVMARELGLNAHVTIRAAFLHDIGKAIDRDLQGSHLELGLDVLRRHGESEPVLQAVAAHHMDIDWPSLEAMLVQAADAISAARPGARRDLLETYVKRLERLEGIAESFKGVAEELRAAGRPRDPHHGRKRARHRRPGRLAVARHRAPHRERAGVPRPDQGHGDPGDASRRLCQVSGPGPAGQGPADPVRTRAGARTDGGRWASTRSSSASASGWRRRPTGCSSTSATMRRCTSRCATALEVITTDAVVDGVHVDRRFVPAAAIGHRARRRQSERPRRDGRHAAPADAVARAS